MFAKIDRRISTKSHHIIKKKKKNQLLEGYWENGALLAAFLIESWEAVHKQKNVDKTISPVRQSATFLLLRAQPLWQQSDNIPFSSSPRSSKVPLLFVSLFVGLSSLKSTPRSPCHKGPKTHFKNQNPPIPPSLTHSSSLVTLAFPLPL